MAYITQFYTWVTGNTVTAARLNGNVSNLVDGLDGGTKDINISKLQIGGTDVISSAQAITNTGDITTTSSTTEKPVWTIKNTNADATAGELQFYKLSASPADNDDVGKITFYGDDDGTNKTLYAQILAESTDVTNTTEDGKLSFYTMTAGTSTLTLTLESSAATFAGDLTAGKVTIDNLVVDGNTLSSSSGDINITPVAGSDVVIDSHFEFDETTLTALTDNNTTITAYAGKNITVESVTFDGGVVAGASSITATTLTDGTFTTTAGAITGVTTLTVDNITINGNDLTASSGELTINDAGADINFRVETQADSEAIKVDAGTNTVKIGTYTFDAGTITTSASEFTFNEAGADINFRIESASSPNAFKLDAGINQLQFSATLLTNVTSLPTSNPSVTGQLWNNSGVVTVS